MKSFRSVASHRRPTVVLGAKTPDLRNAAWPLPLPQRVCTCRNASTKGRTYYDAVRLLWELQPNRRVTNLFEQHQHQQSLSASSPSTVQQNRGKLNAAAIPEMRYWLRRAGYKPEDLARIRHIHVAGTKGKGSVCAYATAMLVKHQQDGGAGSVGTYTSPHLVSPRERIAINGEPVSKGQFTRAFFRLWDRFTKAAMKEGRSAEEAESPETKPFFFRYLTIMAWHIFLRKNVENVVMECGIGGEYDSTNVLPVGSVSSAVVTQLGIDHVAMLGNTVEEIAWHKAGIFKPGVRGFTRSLADQPAVMDVLRKRATQKGAGLIEVPDALVESWGGVESGLKGGFQKYNQALALLAVMHHIGMDSDPEVALRNVPPQLAEGLRGARLRGRCEVIHDGQAEWLLDGAHTRESLEQVAIWLAQTIEKDEAVVLVFNQQERDASQLLSDFVRCVQQATQRNNVFAHAIFTRNEQERPSREKGEEGGEEEARDLTVQNRAAVTMSEIQPACRTQVFENVEDAVVEARRLVRGGAVRRRVLATGSLHLVGGILRALEPESLV